jgi:hypothetical protein
MKEKPCINKANILRLQKQYQSLIGAQDQPPVHSFTDFTLLTVPTVPTLPNLYLSPIDLTILGVDLHIKLRRRSRSQAGTGDILGERTALNILDLVLVDQGLEEC